MMNAMTRSIDRVTFARFGHWARVVSPRLIIVLMFVGCGCDQAKTPDQDEIGVAPALDEDDATSKSEKGSEDAKPAEFHSVDLTMHEDLQKLVGRRLAIKGAVFSAKDGDVMLSGIKQKFVVCSFRRGVDVSQLRMGSDVEVIGVLSSYDKYFVNIHQCEIRSSIAPKDPVATTTVNELVLAFEEDAAAATKSYLSKQVQLSGTLISISGAEPDKVYCKLQTKGLKEPRGINCEIAGWDFAKLRPVYGQGIVVNGVCLPAGMRPLFPFVRGSIAPPDAEAEAGWTLPDGSVSLTMDEFEESSTKGQLDDKIPQQPDTLVVLTGKVTSVDESGVKLTSESGRARVTCHVADPRPIKSLEVGNVVSVGGYLGLVKQDQGVQAYLHRCLLFPSAQDRVK